MSSESGVKDGAVQPSRAPEMEARTIRDLYSQAPLVVGDKWCAIPLNWWQAWTRYTGYGQPARSSIHPPGPVKNEQIMQTQPRPRAEQFPPCEDEPEQYRLCKPVVLQKAFKSVPSRVYVTLHQWYSGGPPIVRTVTEEGGRAVLEWEKLSLKVVLWPPKLGRSKPSELTSDSRQDVLDLQEHGSLLLIARPGLKVKEARQMLIQHLGLSEWRTGSVLLRDFHKRSRGKALDDDSSLRECRLEDGQRVLLECVDPTSGRKEVDYGSWFDGFVLSQESSDDEEEKKLLTERVWPEDGAGGSASVRGSSPDVTGRWKRPSVLASAEKDSYPARGTGMTGLDNLGNTCFMNSGLQCLSHTEELTDFFLSNRYLGDINESNPLGAKGALARSYGKLIKSLWSGRQPSVAPRDFKYTVGEHAPQFRGYRQHDAQEFLSFLLDGLHEDLNRVLDKPYVPAKDSNGRSDEVVAKEAWRAHLKRNQSVVVDLFQGQFKSKIACPHCQRVSVTFDPFMYLSLPVVKCKSKAKASVVNARRADASTKASALNGRKTGISTLNWRKTEASVLNGSHKHARSSNTLPRPRLSVANAGHKMVEAIFLRRDGRMHQARLAWDDSDASWRHDWPHGRAIMDHIKEWTFPASIWRLVGDSVELFQLPHPHIVDNQRLLIAESTGSSNTHEIDDWLRTKLSRCPTLVTRSSEWIARLPQLLPFIVNALKRGTDMGVVSRLFPFEAGVNREKARSELLGVLGEIETELPGKSMPGEDVVGVNPFHGQVIAVQFACAVKSARRNSWEWSSSVTSTTYASLPQECTPLRMRRTADLLLKRFSPPSTIMAEAGIEPYLVIGRRLNLAKYTKDPESLATCGFNGEPAAKARKLNERLPRKDVAVRPVVVDCYSATVPASSSSSVRANIASERDAGRPMRLSSSDTLFVVWRVKDRSKCPALLPDWFSGPGLKGGALDYRWTHSARKYSSSFSSPGKPRWGGAFPKRMGQPYTSGSGGHSQPKFERLTLQDCFESFTADERLGVNDEWYCNNCKAHRRAFKKLDIWMHPKILVVHLKRFRQEGHFHREKIESLVDFPLKDLDLSKHVLGLPPGSRAVYDLFAVTNHSGSASCGHYTAYVNTAPGWKHLDDSTVTDASTSDVVSRRAYVLFYRLREAGSSEVASVDVKPQSRRAPFGPALPPHMSQRQGGAFAGAFRR